MTDAASLNAFRERLRASAARPAALETGYFEQIVVPLWQAFDQLHREGLSALQQYATAVDTPDPTLETLLRRVEQGAVVAEALRGDLANWVAGLSSLRLKSRAGQMLDFALTLREYAANRAELHVVYAARKPGLLDTLFNPAAAEATLVYHPPALPAGALQAQKRIAEAPLSRRPRPAARQRARALLQQAAADLQSRYNEVAATYHRLEKRLASPKWD